MNRIAFLYGAETRRLKKIIHKTRDRDLCRRANAVLLVLKGKTKSEVASLLQAGRSSLNRWLKWYDVAGVDGLKTKGVGLICTSNSGHFTKHCSSIQNSLG
jgi:hypothetical protein